jgi:GlpG protein
VLDARTIQIFVIWLVGCVVATYLKVWEVGNAARIGGLLFGGAVAGSFLLRFRPRLIFSGLVALVVFSIVPLFWCPWSITWLSDKAYNAHAAAQYDVAVKRYTQITNLDPDNAWAYLNRSYAYQALGQLDKAQADLQRAREIDPSIEQAK